MKDGDPKPFPSGGVRPGALDTRDDDLREALSRLVTVPCSPELSEVFDDTLNLFRLEFYDIFGQPESLARKGAKKDFLKGRAYQERAQRLFELRKSLGWQGDITLEEALEAFRQAVVDMGKQHKQLIQRITDRSFRILGNFGPRETLLTAKNVVDLVDRRVVTEQELRSLVLCREVLGVEAFRVARPLEIKAANLEEFVRQLQEGDFNAEIRQTIQKIRTSQPQTTPEEIGEFVLKAIPKLLERTSQEIRMPADSRETLLLLIEQVGEDVHSLAHDFQMELIEVLPKTMSYPQAISAACHVLQQITKGVQRFLDLQQKRTA